MFFLCSPLFGEGSHVDEYFFQMGGSTTNQFLFAHPKWEKDNLEEATSDDWMLW